MAVLDLNTGKALIDHAQPNPSAQPTQSIEDEIAANEAKALEKLAQETGPFESAVISAGRGFTNIGRALGLVDEEEPVTTRAIQALKKENPISTEVGEIVGETAPFLIPGVGIGAIPGTVARVAAATGLGIAEGGIIAESRKQDVVEGASIGGAVAGSFEALFPIIGRLGGALIRKVTGKQPLGAVIDSNGRPSPELADALDQSGFTFDELTSNAVETLKASPGGANPKEAARLAQLESLGAPATKGDISDDFAQKALEEQLVGSATEKLGDPLRAIRLEQSRAFKARLDGDIDSLGVSDDVGASIKEALEGRKETLTSEKNALYTEIANTSPNIKAAPIFTDKISAAIPDLDTLDNLAITAGDTAIQSVDDLLVKFGINRDSDDVERFLKRKIRGRDSTIKPLNIGNFDQFRKSLNAIPDPTGALAPYTQPVKRALDEEADLIDNALRSAGITDSSITGTLKEARSIVRRTKTEFSPQAISGRLIAAKRDGVSPLIETSKVYGELMGGQKAPELVERTIKSLMESGSKGKKAIGDLQARTIVDLIDSAFKANTRKISGEIVFGNVAFKNKLKQIGDRRLKAVFSTRPDMLKKIKQVASAAELLTVPDKATPKGSASVVLDLVNKLGIATIANKLPAGAALISVIKTAAENGASRATLEKALNAKPNVKRIATFIANEAPSLAAAIGIPFLVSKEENK